MLKTAYKLTLVLHVTNHPLLTPTFVQELERDVANSLRIDLGKAATVEVVRQHALLDQVLKSGWESLNIPADRLQRLDDRKVHLLRIDYADGQYAIQTRQVDGYTGLVSPLRREQTPDRGLVSRLAALTVARDFGLVGVLGEATGRVIKLNLKGTGPKSSEMLRVERGEVFAIVQVRQGQQGQLQAVRVPDALLYVVDLGPGGCTTRLVHRYKDPLQSDRGTAGFRAVKLGTGQSHLDLRVLDAKTGNPVPGASVTASAGGLESAQTTDLGVTDSQGRIRSKEPFSRVAFVRVSLGGVPRAEIPIPIVDDQPVEVRVNVE